MVLIDVDPAYFKTSEEYLPRARKVLERHKLEWPNTIAPNGFNDTVRVFNLSGYGNIVVDGQGIVRGVNVHGKEFEHLIDTIVESKETQAPAR